MCSRPLALSPRVDHSLTLLNSLRASKLLTLVFCIFVLFYASFLLFSSSSPFPPLFLCPSRHYPPPAPLLVANHSCLVPTRTRRVYLRFTFSLHLILFIRLSKSRRTEREEPAHFAFIALLLFFLHHLIILRRHHLSLTSTSSLPNQCLISLFNDLHAL
ncbi:hypothetical protein EDD21DRAFT_198281 [Dissophora ornata]|nr:hypothetical protein EDD21DRAFT_198281 [Dissophora ornata]